MAEEQFPDSGTHLAALTKNIRVLGSLTRKTKLSGTGDALFQDISVK